MNTKQLDTLWKAGREFLGVRYPILCGAMTWISDFKLVKTIHDHGGFGVLAGGNLSPEVFEETVDRLVAELGNSFGVNLITIAPNFQTQLEILQGKNVPVVIFAGNFPHKHDVRKMKDSGKKTLSFASTISIVQQQIRFGIDGLILEGSEAGGHIGQVSLSVLLQQVLFESPPVPVFVAGGIATGRMMAHLLLMGAAGCQFGTRFVMSEECTAHPNFKKAFIKARAREAVATPAFDKRLPVVPVRALRNRSSDEFNILQLDLMQKLKNQEISRHDAQMQVEKFWVGGLRRAVVDGDIDRGSLMAGQSVGLVKKIQPMAEIFAELINDAEDELTRVRQRLG